MHRRVEIGKPPFVGRNLAVGMLELLEQQHPQIFLGKLRIDQRQRRALKCQVPGREPGKLPLVRHGKNAHRIQVTPVNVAHVFARLGRREFRVVAFQPAIHVPQINLLAPEHSCQGLALNEFLVGSSRWGMHRGVELVGFRFALTDNVIHIVERRRQLFRSQPQPQHHRPAGGNGLVVVNARLGAGLLRIQAVFLMNNVPVKRIFYVRLAVLRAAVKLDRVALIVGEHRLPALFGVEVLGSQ